MHQIGRFIADTLRRAMMLAAHAVSRAARALLAVAVLSIGLAWRFALAFAVLGGLYYVIAILVLGRLPANPFWQGMMLMLLLVSALLMARGPRALRNEFTPRRIAPPRAPRRAAIDA